MATNIKKRSADSLENMADHLCSMSDLLGEIRDSSPFTVQDATSITESLESIAKSLESLIQIKKQTQRNRSNGLNFSPSPKHSQYLKRRMITTADGRKTKGKITFSRTGKRLFIQNKNGYTSE